WYRFTLDRPARVTLATLDQAGGSPLVSVLGLYNSEPNNRLLAQDDGAAGTGDAHLERPLAAGTYYVAVSGSGGSALPPRLAGSGPEGSTGDYGLLITATDLAIDPADGPHVLVSEPADAAVLNASPLELLVNFSTPLDVNSIFPDQTVQLSFNA